MQNISISIRVSYAWWAAPYLHTLGLMCAICGADVDAIKVAKTVMRGMRFKVSNAKES